MARLLATVGRGEKGILDRIEAERGIKILRQYVIEIGKRSYVVDGYCPETRTAFEVQEMRHALRFVRDLARAEKIERALGATVEVIWDDSAESGRYKIRPIKWVIKATYSVNPFMPYCGQNNVPGWTKYGVLRPKIALSQN